MFKTTLKLSLCALLLSGCSESADTPAEPSAEPPAEAAPGIVRSAAPEGARAFFITPADGATLQSPVTIEFGIEGMDVAPAGQDVEGTGHHHLIIDAGLPPLDQPIPANDNYRHFGDGSTTATIELAPGTHTLQMLLGDHLHIPHEPPVYSQQITITVE